MFNIVLLQPEIPPNTGNIIRLCANTGANLHLIRPLGFNLNDKQLRRAGLDHHATADLKIHDDYAAYLAHQPQRVLACSTKGKINYHTMTYQAGDALLFGPETRGLPVDLLDEIGIDNTIRIPMTTHSRSLNLANAVAIILYEAWRQFDFQV